MRTLFLMPDTWDLTIDANGNIAVAEDVYQQAQDIATAARVFIGDMYYNQNAGIPYRESILGQTGFPLSLYKMHLEDAAMSIQGVESANAILNLVGNRTVTGDILFTTESGESGAISL